MARTADGLQLGVASCVATTDAILRALAQISSRSELAALMDTITSELGFRHYALIHHDDLRGEPAHRVKLLDYPAAIEDRIITQGTWRRDPIIRGCLFAQRAFHWSELPGIITMDRRDRECFALGARVGLNEGITVPYWALGDCMGSCTFAGTRAPKRVAQQLGMAQMIGIFAFQAARRVLTGSVQMVGPKPRLHPRPREFRAPGRRGLPVPGQAKGWVSRWARSFTQSQKRDRGENVLYLEMAVARRLGKLLQVVAKLVVWRTIT